MASFISTTLSKLSDRVYLTLSIGIAIAIGTSPVAATLLLINSGSLSIKTENREIDFKGKGRAVAEKNDEKVEKLQTQFDELYSDYQELARIAERRKSDRVLNSQVEKLDRSFTESGIRLDDVKESQKEVEEFVEKALEE